jgi:hypothetical protein
MTKLATFRRAATQIIDSKLFDENGDSKSDILILVSDPERAKDFAQVFVEKPWLYKTAQDFVKGMCLSGMEPREVLAFLGSAMVSGLIPLIDPEELDSLADDLLASAAVLTRASRMVLERSPEVMALVEEGDEQVR